MDEIRIALEEREIEGALLDTYIAAENKGTLLDDRVFVKKVLDWPVGYGVVLSGAARNVEQRCRDYIALHISEIYKIIENKTKALEVRTVFLFSNKTPGINLFHGNLKF